MTQAEKELLRQLETNVDSFEDFFENDDADAPVISKRPLPGSARLSNAKGNPAFSAQFDVTILLKYFTFNTGAYTAIGASALNAALKNKLPVYIFGQSDFASGFINLRRTFPLTTWIHGRPFIYGRDIPSELTLDATVTGTLQLGDLVIPFTSALPGAGTTTLALAIVRCTQVAYGTLLNALSSDRFVMNMIRYVIPDITTITQYSNNIGYFTQSLFGKFHGDYTSPNSFKKPEQQQNGLIDIPLKVGIDKQKALAMYVNYDCVELSWSIFVWTVKKVEA